MTRTTPLEAMYNLYEAEKEKHNNIPFYAVMKTRYIVDPEFYKRKEGYY